MTGSRCAPQIRRVETRFSNPNLRNASFLFLEGGVSSRFIASADIVTQVKGFVPEMETAMNTETAAKRMNGNSLAKVVSGNLLPHFGVFPG